MSYCRWSCLNGYSDVYVYEDVSGGWTTHLASLRQPAGKPFSGLDLAIQGDGTDEHPAWVLYKESERLARDWLDKNPGLKIDHPEAGTSVNHETPGECADNLERLRGEGFIVPFSVIPELRQEQLEMDEEEFAILPRPDINTIEDALPHKAKSPPSATNTGRANT